MIMRLIYSNFNTKCVMIVYVYVSNDEYLWLGIDIVCFNENFR